MAIFIGDQSKIVCMGCGVRPQKEIRTWGPYDESRPEYERWHDYRFVCRHSAEGVSGYWVCLSCFKASHHKCPQCGEGAEYC